MNIERTLFYTRNALLYVMFTSYDSNERANDHASFESIINEIRAICDAHNVDERFQFERFHDDAFACMNHARKNEREYDNSNAMLYDTRVAIMRACVVLLHFVYTCEHNETFRRDSTIKQRVYELMIMCATHYLCHLHTNNDEFTMNDLTLFVNAQIHEYSNTCAMSHSNHIIAFVTYLMMQYEND